MIEKISRIVVALAALCGIETFFIAQVSIH